MTRFSLHKFHTLPFRVQEEMHGRAGKLHQMAQEADLEVQMDGIEVSLLHQAYQVHI